MSRDSKKVLAAEPIIGGFLFYGKKSEVTGQKWKWWICRL